MQKMTKEQIEKQIIIDEYEFNSHTRYEKTEKAFKEAIAALQPIIEENLRYLRYAQAKDFFVMGKEEETRTATHNAIVSLIGRVFKWEPYDAETLAFKVLQDVNLHEEAAQVKKVLGLNLKPYEVE
jgi:hypothetical protein